MLTKLALLFLAFMGLLVIISGRPKPGDGGWRNRFRLSSLKRPSRRDPPEDPPRGDAG